MAVDIAPLQTSRGLRGGWWFALFAGLVFCGEVFADWASQLFSGNPAGLAGWLAYGVVAVVIGAIGALLLEWLVLDPLARLRAEFAELQSRADRCLALEATLAESREWQRRLRHDLRGVLSPALLTADRLLTNEDPKVQRAGNMMVQAVERAAALMAEPDK